MIGRCLNVEHWAEIRRLYQAEGMPIRRICRQLGVGRNTARALIAAGVDAAQLRFEWPQPERPGSRPDLVIRSTRARVTRDRSSHPADRILTSFAFGKRSGACSQSAPTCKKPFLNLVRARRVVV